MSKSTTYWAPWRMHSCPVLTRSTYSIDGVPEVVLLVQRLQDVQFSKEMSNTYSMPSGHVLLILGDSTIQSERLEQSRGTGPRVVQDRSVYIYSRLLLGTLKVGCEHTERPVTIHHGNPAGAVFALFPCSQLRRTGHSTRSWRRRSFALVSQL